MIANKWSFLILLLIWFLSRSVCSAQQLRACTTEELVVPKDSFTLESLTRLATARLARSTSEKFLLVEYVPERHPPELGITDPSYQWWIRSWTNSPRGGVAAQLIRTRDGAVLRLKDRSEIVTTKVLQGNNPLHLFFAGKEFRVLLVDPGSERIFLVGEAPEGGLAERLALTASKVMPCGPLTVRIRNSQWFIPYLPAAFPFLERLSPISYEEWLREKEVVCNVKGSDATCGVYNGQHYERLIQSVPTTKADPRKSEPQ